MAHKQISTIFKKWDLLVTLEGKYVRNSFIYSERHVSSALSSRVRYARNEHLYCLQAIHTSSNCRAHKRVAKTLLFV